MRWDLFCRAIDNFGDIGVGWRLAADLGARGEAVRLWLDDPAPLAWMAPRGAAGVAVVPWTETPPDLAPYEVVVELFGCDPPPRFVERMAAAVPPPVWVDLEHLSAEDYVERSHGLPSPQFAGPGRGLVKWFFFPGFTPRTGGLLRERGLMTERQAFDRAGWLAAQGLPDAPGAALMSVFCYDGPPLPLPAGLRPLLTPGAAQRRFAAAPGAVMLPWLTQPAYDRLLWACALNIVRGEDSFVRAQWAGAPFVWHIYPQHDGAHRAKLEAFLDRFLEAAEPAFAQALRALWRGFNGLGPWPGAWPDAVPWRAACAAWRERLLAQDDLAGQLCAFVAARR